MTMSLTLSRFFNRSKNEKLDTEKQIERDNSLKKRNLSSWNSSAIFSREFFNSSKQNFPSEWLGYSINKLKEIYACLKQD